MELRFMPLRQHLNSILRNWFHRVRGTLVAPARFNEARELAEVTCWSITTLKELENTMKNKLYTMVLACLLGLGTLAAQTSVGSAGAIPAFPQNGASQAADSSLLQDVASRGNHNGNYMHNRNNMHYNRNSHGYRCNSWSGNCRHYHNGYYYQNEWWIVPGIIGGAIIQDSVNHRYGNSHVRWCQQRYRSYNPRTNLWLSNSGQYRQCRGPY
jgi:hypothetical protein